MRAESRSQGLPPGPNWTVWQSSSCVHSPSQHGRAAYLWRDHGARGRTTGEHVCASRVSGLDGSPLLLRLAPHQLAALPPHYQLVLQLVHSPLSGWSAPRTSQRRSACLLSPARTALLRQGIRQKPLTPLAWHKPGRTGFTDPSHSVHIQFHSSMQGFSELPDVA